MDFYQEIPFLVEHLHKGNLILYPTDPIWGIGCDATNAAAIAKIDALKQRKSGKNYVVLIDTYEHLENYVEYIPVKARNLIEFHQRPLTIVYGQAKNLPVELVAEDGSIAIRVTKDPFCQKLIKEFGKPIISTSANISGEPFPVSYEDIDTVIINQITAIAKHKQTEKMNGMPSVIVKVEDNKDLLFLRK